jgi:hypothetical protein
MNEVKALTDSEKQRSIGDQWYPSMKQFIERKTVEKKRLKNLTAETEV